METSAVTRNGPLASLDALRSLCNILLAASSGVLMLRLWMGAMNMLAHRSSGVLVLLVVLLGLLIGLTGYCAVTQRCLQASQGAPQSGFVGALGLGLFAAVKVVLALLLLLLGLLVLMLVMAVIFLVTQIPGIGPALNYVVFPLIALVLGVALYTLIWIALPLICVCSCEGRSVFGSVATVLVVVRSRLLDVALRGILVVLIAALVLVLASYISTLGIIVTAKLQAMVHISSESHSYAYGMRGYGMRGNPLAMLQSTLSGDVTALLLYFLAASLGFVVHASGWVTVFNDCARELDPTALETQMRTHAERMQQKAREAQARAAQMAREHAQKAAARKSGDGDDDSAPPTT